MKSAENTTIEAFRRFRDEVQAAGLRMDNATIIQLMIADRLNVVGQTLNEVCGNLADLAGRE
jgi:hypothetical protein